MKTVTLALLVLGLLLGNIHPASAELRVGTVDVKKILAGYGRAKAADREMKTLADGMKRELDERAEKQKALEVEVRGVNQNLQKPEISPAKKAGLSQDLEKKYGELQLATSELRALAKEQDVNFGNQRRRISQGILEEIKKVTSEIAVSKGYDMVFDTSGSGINAWPMVFYANPSLDFTKTVLEKLNEGQPGGEGGEKVISKAPAHPAEVDKKK
jgi:Skp family chaperone for outer membrane proteins